MKFYDNFIKTFFSEIDLIHEKESDKIFEAKLTSKIYNFNSIVNNEELIDFLNNRDNLHFSIGFGAGESIIFKTGSSTLEKFKKELDKEARFHEEVDITIVFTINKTFSKSECSIYDLEVFTTTLENLNTYQFVNVFSAFFEQSSILNFKVLNLEKEFYSKTIHFSEIDSNLKEEKFEIRNEIIENFRSTCHFSQSEKLKIIPDDFALIKTDHSKDRLNLLFKKYSSLIAIIFLFDITSIIDNHLDFKINGYKSIKGIIDINQIKLEEIEEYFEIYLWVYTGGNLNDKIGLARNIISLHFSNKGNLNLQGNPFQAVKSSYKVYERQNIKQYIEIRNKISDQLIDFNNRANKIIETFASGFQKSSLALISFYISAIAIKVLGKGEFISVFSLDATVLSISFLVGCSIYYKVSRWEINEQRKRFVSSYQNLKIRYTDLLNEEDINRILNNDKEFNEDVEFIDNKKKKYSSMWLSLILILGFTTLFLFFCYNLNQLFDTFLFKILFKKSCDCN